MRIRFCPNCGSDELILDMGGQSGKYTCKKCGFKGSVFPEKEVKK